MNTSVKQTEKMSFRMQAHKDLTDPAKLLPWDEARLSQADQKKLGRFQKAIMKLLQRDSCMRATARQFSEDVRGIFANEAQPGTASGRV